MIAEFNPHLGGFFGHLTYASGINKLNTEFEPNRQLAPLPPVPAGPLCALRRTFDGCNVATVHWGSGYGLRSHALVAEQQTLPNPHEKRSPYDHKAYVLLICSDIPGFRYVRVLMLMPKG